MKKSVYKIEKGIPIPQSKTSWSKFPFAYMDVGDSFFVPKKSEKQLTLIQLKSFLWRKQKEYLMDVGSIEKFCIFIDREKEGARVFKIK